MSELPVSALRSRSSAERRTAAAVGAAAIPVGCFAIVAALAATNGGYFPTAWGWSALVLAAAAAIALILRADITLDVGTLAWVGAWTALAAWYALSIAWSEAKPESVDEVERILVYVAATAAVAAAVRAEVVGRLLAATLTGIAAVSVYSLATRLFPDRIG